MPFTVLTPKAAAIARPLARGCYQVDLLAGRNSWVGSDLKGAAARSWSSYRDSRDSFIQRMQEAGLYVERTKGTRGGIIVVAMTKAERSRAKDVSALDRANAIIDRADRSEVIARLKAKRDARRAERQFAEDLPALAALA